MFAYVLAAYRKGGKLKFANHSSNPNCYAKVIAAYMMVEELNRKGYSGYLFSVPSFNDLKHVYSVAAPVLDEDFGARVADFGLTMAIDAIGKGSNSMSVIAGSSGYIVLGSYFAS